MSEEPEVLEADTIAISTMEGDPDAEPSPSTEVVMFCLTGRDLKDTMVVFQMTSDDAIEIAEELIEAAEEVDDGDNE